MQNYDLSLLNKYSVPLPNLVQGFAEACTIPADKRLQWAKEQRKHIFRDGWYINTPVGQRGSGETVQDHIIHLLSLIERFFPSRLQEEAKIYAEYHDDHEVLAHAVIDGIKRDLNPLFNQKSYAITLEDKATIEASARKILFEAQPELRHQLDQYPNGQSEAARFFSQLDKICVMWRCADFVESEQYQYSDFQAYWDYWTPENVEKKCGEFITDLYKKDVWSRVQKLMP